MSVSNSPVSRAFQDLLQIEESSQFLVVGLGRRKEMTDSQFARCRKEIARLVGTDSRETIVFDFQGMLVLPPAFGIDRRRQPGRSENRVINASHAAQENFHLTGLDRMIELEPAPAPPAK